jgi:uncharacterized protein (DUF2141 family)
MLEGLEPPKQKFTCKVSILLSDLDKKDGEILQAAIDDARKWPAKSLQKALKERGVSLADTVISKHRTKLCRCYKD